MRNSWILAIVCLLFLTPIISSANDTNSVLTYTGDNFEIYDGNILGTNGWYGDTNEITATTIQDTNFTFSGGSRPLGGSGDSGTTDILSLEAGSSSLTNLFNSAAETNTWMDMMVQMNPAEDPPAVITNDSSVQCAVYLNANSNLVVWHTQWYTGTTYSNQFTTLTNITIDAGEWVRLTLLMDYTTADQGGGLDKVLGNKFFKVIVNGTDVTSTNGYPAPIAGGSPAGPGLPSGGAWFINANRASATTWYLSSVNLSGAGLFDEFMTTASDPFTPDPTTYTVTVANVVGGWIEPAEQVVANGNSTTNFHISVSNGYFLVRLIEEASTNITPATTHIVSTVTSNQTFTALFETNSLTLTNGISEVWMQTKHGIFTNDYAAAADVDHDSDGFTTSQEFLASTDPTNAASSLKISMAGYESSSPKIKWVSYYDSGDNLPPFGVMYTTNITDSGSWAWATNVTRSAGGPYTNEWTVPGGFQGIYYKVVATNQ